MICLPYSDTVSFCINSDSVMMLPGETLFVRQIGQGCTSRRSCLLPLRRCVRTGHTEGISSLLVPGSREPNFGSYVANPYETLKQR